MIKNKGKIKIEKIKISNFMFFAQAQKRGKF